MAASELLKGRSIAVVGAGMAGLGAARVLAGFGADVAIFDRSRGVGGRVATKLAGDLSFDHGAQFATAHRLDFAAIIGSAEAKGQAAVWTPRYARADQDGALTPATFTETRHVGTPGMNALPQALAQGLPITFEHRVIDLARGGGRWSLRFDNGTSRDGFESIVLAIPAPQALALVTGISELATIIASATYAPCWAAMMGFDQALDLAADAISIDDPVLAWAARDSAKPGRAASPERWVLHASPDWSRAHVEEAPETVATTLLDRFQTLFGVTPAPSHIAAHRWRYALVEQAVAEPCLWDASLGLGACGDWCLGPRVEAAFDSGVALANLIAGA